MKTRRFLRCLAVALGFTISSLAPVVVHPVAAQNLRQSVDTVELLSGELSLPVSLRCPSFAFNTAVVGGTQLPSQMSGNLLAGEELVAHYAPLTVGETATLEVRLHLTWSVQEGVLRKWAEYRLSPAPPGCVLHEIQLEKLAPVAGQAIGFLPAPPQSQPGFLRGFFAGVEFPVASTRMEGSSLVLAHRPGRALHGDSGWLTSRQALYGTAPVGRERATFAALIDSHRPAPKALHFNYNSWWSMSFPCSEQDVLSLMQPFADNLYKPYATAFDMFAIDMGWSDPKTLWEINACEMPLTESHSESQWVATGLPASEYWTILTSPLAEGDNRISLNLLSGLGTTAVSCWAWSYKNTTDEPVSYPGALPMPEQLYLDSSALLDTEVILPTMPIEQQVRPVVQINGVYLDTLKPIEATQEFGVLQINQNIVQKPMRIQHKYFARGLGSHSKARIVYDIAGREFRRFQCWVGADSENQAVSSITFTIQVDGEKRWESGLMTAQDPARLVNIDVTGAKTLELVVGDAGDGNVCDHADFGDARLLRE